MPVLSEYYTDSSFMPLFPPLSLQPGTERADIIHVLQVLPAADRLILSLVYVEQLKLADVALVLNMQAGEVLMMYLRAQERFTESLGQLVPHPLIV